MQGKQPKKKKKKTHLGGEKGPEAKRFLEKGGDPGNNQRMWLKVSTATTKGGKGKGSKEGSRGNFDKKGVKDRARVKIGRQSAHMRNREALVEKKKRREGELVARETSVVGGTKKVINDETKAPPEGWGKNWLERKKLGPISLWSAVSETCGVKGFFRLYQGGGALGGKPGKRDSRS